jgi:hypothetical protein
MTVRFLACVGRAAMLLTSDEAMSRRLEGIVLTISPSEEATMLSRPVFICSEQPIARYLEGYFL